MHSIKVCLREPCNIVVKLLVVLIFLTGAKQASADVCWKATYGRGVGIIPGTCDSAKQDKSGLLCYDKCKPGYTGVAGVCWQNCPEGFTDTGAHCLKTQSYGRADWSHTWALHNKASCDEQNKAVGGCEQWGAFYYQKCKAGFYPVLCCTCSPSCPPGMVDIGVSCQKHSYVLPPITPTCGSMQYDTGLCYNTCNAQFYGVGPVCWGQCPADKPYDCGAMCGTSAMDCLTSVGEMVMAIGSSVSKIAGIIGTLGGSAGATLATDAAKNAAITGIKEAAKKIAKDVAKKLASAAKTVIAGKVAAELKNIPGMPAGMADKLASMASDADNFDYVGFLTGLDPTGLAQVAMTFVKPICQVIPSSIPPVPKSPPPGAQGKTAQGPGWCAKMLEGSQYLGLVQGISFKDWTAADKGIAVQILGQATSIPFQAFLSWPNEDIYAGMTASCHYFRSAPDIAHLTTITGPGSWTKENRERVNALVGIATGISLPLLEKLNNYHISGFLGRW